MKLKIIKEWLMRLLAILFGRYSMGIDWGVGQDRSTKCEGFWLWGKFYVTNIKEIK